MKKYEHKKIEEKWLLLRNRGETQNERGLTQTATSEKYYILDMFPYPSGDGLHMGHTESYTASDIIYRYKKLQGFDVLHPQGFDSFGLPAENYAIKTGVHPKETTETNASNYIEQMKMLGLGHDLNHLVYTSNPSYYKWTQWLFGKFFENGLVEQKTDKINWCPSCNTGIANEQVEDGKCERCKTEIEQKEVPGWFFKITDFAEDLINDLDKVDWPEATKKNQKAWIGRSEGAKIKFEIRNLKFEMNDEILNDTNEKMNVVLVHGCGDNEEDKKAIINSWLAWAKERLEKANIQVSLPLFNPLEPNYQEWKKKFEKLDINKNSILIGHSCGCSFLVRWLGETGQTIKKLILVAPWKIKSEKYNQGENELYDFTVNKSVKNQVREIIIFTSDNEAIDGKKSVKIFSDELSAKLIELKNHGHYVETHMGTVEFPELLEEIIGKQKPNVVLMHGKNTGPQEKWYPWLAEEMNKRGVKFTAPKLPSADDPNIESWKKELSKAQPNENSILIGHSRGGVAILRWLEDQLEDFKVKKVILVATNSGDSAKRNKTENNKGFFSKDGYDFEKIKQHCDDFMVLHSEDDEWVPFSAGQENAKGLDAKFLRFKDRGHFGSKLPEQKIPELLEEILSEIKSSPRESVSGLRNSATSTEVEVFTTRPDTLFGATYLVVAPEHPLIKNEKLKINNYDEVHEYIDKAKNKTEMERLESKEKTGVKLEGLVAINPANNEEIPIFVADYVLGGYGTGAIMAVPAHDERDFEFAKKYNIPIRQVVAQKFVGEGENAIREDKPMTERKIVDVIIKHWEKDEFFCLDWSKKTGKNWHSFVVGGVEERETLEEAALREAREETGYQNMRAVKQVGGEIHSYFYAAHKGVNRAPVKRNCIYLELTDGEWKEPAEEHTKNHDGVWVEKDKVAQVINLSELKIYWNIFIGKQDALFTGQGEMINSGQFDGMDSEEAKKAITEFVGGEMTINYRLRDWSISRQRYWGCPIPIVYSPEGEAKFVGEENLPWLLPEDVDFVPTGTAPLAKSKELKERTEKLFGKGWTPEVDTMDTFVDSSWYFLRYPDTENEKEFCSAEKLKKWMPVDLYIGGAEHTYMHLLYARFFVKAMHKMGLIEFDEPFLKLRHQGMVLDKDGIKMSKSKGNVVNPNDMVEKFGADATRMYMMFAAPLDEEIAFKEEGVKGVYRFLEKVWKLFQNKVLIDCEGGCGEVSKELPVLLHKTIKGVTEDIEGMKFNTAISKLMIFVNEFSKHEKVPRGAMEKFLILLSPFAPFITEELWLELGHKDSIFNQEWPKYNLEMIKEEEIELVVQINGKLRDKIKVPADISEEKAREKSLASEKIQKYTDGKEIRKVIFVKGRLVNIVV